MWHPAFARANQFPFRLRLFSSVFVARRRKQLSTRFCRREIIMTLVSQSTGQTESRCNRGEMQLTSRYHNPITPSFYARCSGTSRPFEQRALIPRENLIFFRSFEFSKLTLYLYRRLSYRGCSFLT